MASLTARVERHRAEVARAEAAAAAAANGGGASGTGLGAAAAAPDSTLSRCTEETASTLSDSEEGRGLLGQKSQMQLQLHQVRNGFEFRGFFTVRS